MKHVRLYLVLLLCALAAVAAIFGGAHQFTVTAIGAFVIFAPGLLLTHLLRIGDSLLSLVVMMMVGPSLWVAIATLAAFSGLWAPTATVLSVAGLLAAVSVVLLVAALRERGRPAPADNRHRFAAHAVEDAQPQV